VRIAAVIFFQRAFLAETGVIVEALLIIRQPNCRHVSRIQECSCTVRVIQ